MDFTVDTLSDDDIISINFNINTKKEDEDKTLVYTLTEMFPEACPQFIRNVCMGKRKSNIVVDELISEILESEYPKRIQSRDSVQALDPAEQLEMMKSILVDADPDYLQMHCHRLLNQPDMLKEFIERAIENRDYPTMKDFLRKQKISAQQKQYTTEFSIPNFLEVIPNPIEYFKESQRKIDENDEESYHYAICYLRNKFNTLSFHIINNFFELNNRYFLKTCYHLEQIQISNCFKRKREIMPQVITNIPLLQEIAFYEHDNEISRFLVYKESEEKLEKTRAKAEGFMLTCSCCFDDEVMPKHIVICDAGCLFCKSCVQKSVEVAFGNGKLDFYCLTSCPNKFSLQVLQTVLSPKMFSAIALKKQMQEVKAAGIEDLETCPFCDFASIPARDDKLFRCFNPDCMKESCRNCKEPSHIPLRCDEIEKDADVKARTYIENKMTEALLRTCYKCGMKFIKEEGCNKMTCSCGALMCYVCGKPVNGYEHFSEINNKKHLCPLFSDTNKLHRDAVLKGAEEAKNEIGIIDSQLKINPTADIREFYNKRQRTDTDHLDIEIRHQQMVMELNARRGIGIRRQVFFQ